jgi:predicted protein tyrosine phosphatase
MFELKIGGIFEAGRWAHNGWPTHTISMVDPGVNLPFTCENHLVIHLHDVESQLRDEWVLPNEQHLDAILDFSKNLQAGDRLLVHCHQGLSRSTAAAIGIMVQHGMDAESAYRYVESVRDILLPNGRIIRMLDDRFNLNNALFDLIMDERRAKMHRHMDNAVSITKHSDVVEMKSILEKIKDLY